MGEQCVVGHLFCGAIVILLIKTPWVRMFFTRELGMDLILKRLHVSPFSIRTSQPPQESN